MGLGSLLRAARMNLVVTQLAGLSGMSCGSVNDCMYNRSAWMALSSWKSFFQIRFYLHEEMVDLKRKKIERNKIE